MEEKNMYPSNSHTNNILNAYIKEGKVNYKDLAEETWLKQQIERIANQDTTKFTSEELLAFWLNAYNLTTIKSVLEYLEKDPNWKGVTTLFQKFKFFIWKKHRIARKNMSLYYLENKIIRKFGDPRIHFALNCASGSCPYLPDRLFSASSLDNYLDSLTRDFINNQQGVMHTQQTLYVSEIFKMYKSDFGGTETNLLAFLKKYWEGTPWNDEISIEYQNYDWSLNTQ